MINFKEIMGDCRAGRKDRGHRFLLRIKDSCRVSCNNFLFKRKCSILRFLSYIWLFRVGFSVYKSSISVYKSGTKF